MGNENSASKENRENKKELDKFDSIKIISNENDSDYNGVKTCIDNLDNIVTNINEKNDINENNGDINNEKSKINLSTECSTGNLSDKELKIPTKFEWREDGNSVYVVGSFNNWSQWFIMNKHNGETFELTLDLPLGTYQYKFIVDKVWRFSKYHPTVKDNLGNINNVIDNSDNLQDLIYNKNNPENGEEDKENNLLDKTKKEKEKTNVKNQKKGNFSLKESSLNSNESQKNDELLGSDYSSIFVPSKDDMNLEANNAPRCYTRPFYLHNLHVIDYKIGKTELVLDRTKVYGDTNSSFISIMNLPPHININHLYSKISSSRILRRTNVLAISSSFRAKNKFFTLVYYKPLK